MMIQDRETSRLPSTLCESARTSLRHVTFEDLEPLADLFSDADVMKFSLDGVFSFEKSKEVVQTMVDNREKYGFSACAVIEKSSGEWMGFCGLWWEEKEGVLTTDFGYRFNKRFWNKGYATEAVSACLEYISMLFPDTEINSYIEAENAASLRVAYKTGMVFVKEDLYHGIPVHAYRYGKVYRS